MTAIKIISRRPGFRLGVEHPAEATYAPDHWTPDQLAVLEGDPNFEVVAATEGDQQQGNGAGPTVVHQGRAPKKPFDPELDGDDLIAAIRKAVSNLDGGDKPTVARISELIGQKVEGKQLGDVVKAFRSETGNK